MFNLTSFRRSWAVALLGGTVLLSACDPDKQPENPTPIVSSDNVIVLNEGAFNNVNASVSVFVPSSGEVKQDVFTANNGRPLGDVAQSMTLTSNSAYIVVNNSHKIEVVSLPGFRSTGTISNVRLPRYMAISGNRGYVTETVSYSRAAGRVAIIDLTTNTRVDTISVGRQPEGIVAAGGKLYVANSGSNTVSVIDPTTKRVETTIPVGDGPRSMAVDRNGRVWVLCGGRVFYNADWTVDYNRTTPGSLVSFLPAAPTATTVRTFTSNRSTPGNLQINGSQDELYFTFNGAVYRMSIADNSLPTTPLIRRRFYGIGVDPKDNTIYGAISTFSAAGKVLRYKSDGAVIDSLAAGIGPNSFLFY